MHTYLIGTIRYHLLSKWNFLLVSSLLIAIWVSFPKDIGVFPLDDTYIHLTHIRNLAETGTLSFNPGELSTGTSSPLWVVVLTPFYWLGLDPYWTVLTVSLLLFVLTSYLTIVTTRSIAMRLGFTSREVLFASSLAGVLLVLNGNMYWLALSGMETLLFLSLGLSGVIGYQRWGFGYRTGIVCGLLYLTHPSGVALPVTLVFLEIANKRQLTWLRGAISMAVIISPYLLFSAYVNGDVLPTTGKGKALTYVSSGFDVDRMWWFIQRFVAYQKFLPQHIPLFVATVFSATIVVWGLLVSKMRCPSASHARSSLGQSVRRGLERPNLAIGSLVRSSNDLRKLLLNDHLLLITLLTWGLFHFALFLFNFRILFHHTRYLAIEYIIVIVVGSLGMAFLIRTKVRFLLGLLLVGTTLGLAGGNIPYWSHVYANNTHHINQVYVNMGVWINENTPSHARIAAFDIGVLRYIGDRYTIDLGGLINDDAHPCLKKRECGGYIHQEKADYVLYSRNPDVDIFPAIYLAEYQGAMLMKQKPLIHFDTFQYEAPTLTHSQRMDLYEIIDWYPHTLEGRIQAFSYDDRAFQPIEELVDERFEFIGYAIDQRVVEKILWHPLGVNFSYLFKARLPLVRPYWIHLAFFDTGRDTISHYMKHMPTHNLLKPHEWPVDELVLEHHWVLIPDSLPVQGFRIQVTISTDSELDWYNLQRYKWFDLGGFEIKKNTIDPITS